MMIDDDDDDNKDERRSYRLNLYPLKYFHATIQPKITTPQLTFPNQYQRGIQ